MKVLHIAAHMGGGIGAAYAGLTACGLDQSIVILEAPIDLVSLSRVRESGFKINICPSRETLVKMLGNSDIVLFNWTHHPALTALMSDFPNIPIRSMVWVHVSGNYFPAIKADFLRLFDQCVFATPYSMQLPKIQAMGKAYASERFAVVYGLGDLERFGQVCTRPHERFTIGYMGTLNSCKFHPDFMDFAAEAIRRTPDIQFVLAGDPMGSEELLNKANERDIANRIHFLGRVTDVPALLAKLDMFAYLLNPQHYGATENALLEAMAAGVPVIALDQCVEKLIVDHGKTGILVDSPRAFSDAVMALRTNVDLRSNLGKNAREHVLKQYTIQGNRKRMLSRYRVCMNSKKKPMCFKGFFGNTPVEWFLSAVEADRDCFLEDRVQDAGRIFRERTKGSPGHYLRYFPGEEKLVPWAREMEE